MILYNQGLTLVLVIASVSTTMSGAAKVDVNNFDSINDLLLLCPCIPTRREVVEVFSVIDVAIETPVSSFLFFIGEPTTIFLGLGNWNNNQI